MATVEFYSKGQVDAKIPSAAQLVPSTSGATSGDVLTFDGSSVGWAAGGGGGGGETVTDVTSISQLLNLMYNANSGDYVTINEMTTGTRSKIDRAYIKCLFERRDVSTVTFTGCGMVIRNQTSTQDGNSIVFGAQVTHRSNYDEVECSWYANGSWNNLMIYSNDIVTLNRVKFHKVS